MRATYNKARHNYLRDLEDRVSDIDTDFNIILESFGFRSPVNETTQALQEMPKDEIEKLVQTLRKDVDKLRKK